MMTLLDDMEKGFVTRLWTGKAGFVKVNSGGVPENPLKLEEKPIQSSGQQPIQFGKLKSLGSWSLQNRLKYDWQNSLHAT